MVDAWEAAVEAQIRSAQKRGEFDNLPGTGKPLPGRDLPYDESWWITSFLEREALPTDLLLPTPLQLRRRVEQLPAEVRDLHTEQSVREFVGLLNREIVDWLRFPSGPRVVVRPVDTEAVLRQWQAHRATRNTAVATAAPPPPSTRPRRRWRWPWRQA
ncbi:J-domain-containing protein [Micromonospora sp. NBC_00421]|uniref:DnaJ family domain-containing protein n=1 Tax=Micromonospora sp. NBC_00421 TaxID=2975976 RepID=UPI002E1AFF79